MDPRRHRVHPVQGHFGAIRYSGSGLGVAIFVSARTSSGAPPSTAWEFELTGPGLPAQAPMKFTLNAGVSQTIAWLYDVAPEQGPYVLDGKSGDLGIALTMSWAPPGDLPAPREVAASKRGAGGAEVSWSPVPGAASYFVSAWNRATGGFAAGQWVAGGPTYFSPGTFALGATFDVYVAATNADMLAGTCPEPLVLAENTYTPASFTSE